MFSPSFRQFLTQRDTGGEQNFSAEINNREDSELSRVIYRLICRKRWCRNNVVIAHPDTEFNSALPRRASADLRKSPEATITSVASLLLITVAAIAAARFWALLPVGTMLAYIYSPDWTEADLVRHIWHFRLVQPEWVSSPPKYSYGQWMMAETWARLLVVFLGWIVCNILADRIYLRIRKKATSKITPGCGVCLLCLFASRIVLSVIN